MKTHFSCQMNGIELGDIDERIAVVDIAEESPALALSTSGNAKYDGTRLIRRTRQHLTVEITLAILERDPARRSEIADKVAAWCQDGYLTVSYRPGQRLRCALAALPGMGSALKWAQELTIRYTAFDWPWWEDELPVVARISQAGQAGGSGVLPHRDGGLDASGSGGDKPLGRGGEQRGHRLRGYAHGLHRPGHGGRGDAFRHL